MNGSAQNVIIQKPMNALLLKYLDPVPHLSHHLHPSDHTSFKSFGKVREIFFFHCRKTDLKILINLFAIWIYNV